MLGHWPGHSLWEKIRKIMVCHFKNRLLQSFTSMLRYSLLWVHFAVWNVGHKHLKLQNYITGFPTCNIGSLSMITISFRHDDIIKWKHFSHYWPFMRGIPWSPVNSPHKGEWRGALMFSLICAWIHGWVNNCKAGDLRGHCAHYDINVMK